MNDNINNNKKINTGLMFGAGMLLVIIAGLTFVTTSWNILTGFGKVGIMCGVTAMFFAGSFMSLKLRLRNTADALYILGAFFATLTVLGIGWFKIFGDWFAIGGEGEMFLYAMAAFVLMIAAFAGALKLDHRPYGFIAWTSLTVFLVCLFNGFFTLQTALVIMSVYSLISVILQKFALKLKNRSLRETYHIFVMINTSVLGVMSVFFETGFLSMAIFTACWMNISLNKNEDMAGGFISGFFMFMTLYCLLSPEGVGDYVFTFSAFVSAMTVLSQGKVINDTISYIFRGISVVVTAVAMVLCLCETMGDWTFSSEFGLLILLVNNVILVYRGNSYMRYFLPFSATLFNIGVVKLMAVPVTVMHYYVFVFLGFAAFVLTVMFSKLRSGVGDGVYSFSLMIATVMSLTLENVGINSYIMLLVCAVMIIYMLLENKHIGGKAAAVFFPTVLWTVLIWEPIIYEEYVPYVIFAAVTAVIVAFDNKKLKVLEISMLVSFTVISTWYVLGYDVLYTLIFTAVWFVKVYVSKDNVRFCPIFIFTVGLHCLVCKLFFEYTSVPYYVYMCIVPVGIMVLSDKFTSLKNKLFLSGEILAYLSMLIMIFSPEEQPGAIQCIVQTAFAAITYIMLCIKGRNQLGAINFVLFYQTLLSYMYDFEDLPYAIVLTLIAVVINGVGGYFKKYQSVEYTSIFSIVPVFALFVHFNSLSPGLMTAAMLIFLTALRIKGAKERKIAFSIAAACFIGELWLQEYIVIPEIIMTEYRVALIAGFMFSLKGIWGKNSTLSLVTYITCIFCIGVLLVDAMHTGLVADGIMLGLAGFFVMVTGFLSKKKKWFTLGTATLVFVSIYMTKDFWLSLGWWVYLLAVGMILIAIAGINEWKKR